MGILMVEKANGHFLLLRRSQEPGAELLGVAHSRLVDLRYDFTAVRQARPRKARAISPAAGQLAYELGTFRAC